MLVDESGRVKLADFGVSKKIHRDHSGRDAGTIYLGGGLGGGVKSNDPKVRQRVQAALQATNLQTMTGTPFFMAPEVVCEEGYGRKADVWALGCTVIEMLSGSQPWKGFNQVAALFAIGDSDQLPELPAGISPTCTDFILKCLTRDKSKRPDVEEMMKHPWLTSA